MVSYWLIVLDNNVGAKCYVCLTVQCEYAIICRLSTVPAHGSSSTIVLLYYCTIVLYCTIVSLQYCTIVLLSCIVLLYYCLVLYYCILTVLYYCLVLFLLFEAQARRGRSGSPTPCGHLGRNYYYYICVYIYIYV